MRQTLLILLLLGIVGCASPRRGMAMRNSTDVELKEAAFKHPVKHGEHNFSTTNFTPGAFFVFFPTNDPIPDKGYAVWKTKDGKHGRQDVEIGRLPNEDGIVVFDFTSEGVKVFFSPWP